MKNRNHAKLPNRPGIALRGIWYLLLFLVLLGISLFFASKLLFGAALGMLLFAVLDLWAAKKEAQKFSGIQAESSKDSFILTLKKEQHSAKIFPSEILFTARLRNLLTGEKRCESLSLTDGKQAELSLGDSCGKYILEGNSIAPQTFSGSARLQSESMAFGQQQSGFRKRQRPNTKALEQGCWT